MKQNKYLLKFKHPRIKIFKDVGFITTPVSKKTALDMITQIKSSKILMGDREKAVMAGVWYCLHEKCCLIKIKL